MFGFCLETLFTNEPSGTKEGQFVQIVTNKISTKVRTLNSVQNGLLSALPLLVINLIIVVVLLRTGSTV